VLVPTASRFSFVDTAGAAGALKLLFWLRTVATSSQLVDVAVFTALLYFTGGPTNPFVSLYLVPISLAAMSLPARYAWVTVALCGAGYALLWWDSVPLPPVHARFGSEFDLHLAGMWITS
jgi:hypothetical protein